MKYTKLPHTDIKVSKICLGTMTWGEQNTEAEGHEQMDYALSQGVNFFDTAEMYSIPGKPETYGLTEKIIGSWFQKTSNREKIVLASKIAGPGIAHIRDTGFSKNAITEALHGSLKSSKAVAEYSKIANNHGLSLTQFSLAFVNQLPFVTGTIIGATKMSQLKENIDSINIDLSQEIIAEINEVHNRMPNPAA